MPTKKKPTGGKGSRRTKSKRAASPRVYQMPKTASELNITCAVCGAPAEWFDYGRVKANDSLAAFICSNEPRSARSEKLLVRAGEQESAA